MHKHVRRVNPHIPTTCTHTCRGHWWCRLTVNTKRMDELKALRFSEAALEDPWVRGGARLSLQLRVLSLSKGSAKRAPRRWRVPPWKAQVEWHAPIVELQAVPVISGVGAGVGIRNKYVTRIIVVPIPDVCCCDTQVVPASIHFDLLPTLSTAPSILPMLLLSHFGHRTSAVLPF